VQVRWKRQETLFMSIWGWSGPNSDRRFSTWPKDAKFQRDK
jgi:hypothetical protein